MAVRSQSLQSLGFPRALIAFLATALVLLLAAAPWPLAWAGLAPLAVAHAAVFDWSLRRPDAFPAFSAFLLGLLLDVLAGPVFGLGALTAVLCHFVAAGQRRFLQPRGIGHAWIGLALTALGIAGLSWLVASGYRSALQPIGPSLAQAALTAALYPPVALLLSGVRGGLGLKSRLQ